MKLVLEFLGSRVSELKNKACLLCLLSSVLLILSFPNFNLWPLAWIGFVPIFFAIEGKSRLKAFLLLYLTGVIFWWGIIYWLVHVTFVGTVILILYLSVYFGLFGVLLRTHELTNSRTHELIIIPSLWVLLEYIRSHLFTGFPWALLGYSQYLNLPVIQIADITGAWGVSFLVMMVNVMIWRLIRGLSKNEKRIHLLPLLCIIFTLFYGYYKIHRLSLTPYALRLKVSVIQGNIAQELKWDANAKSYILDRYSELTNKAAALSPDLIVWPEASSPGLLGEDAFVLKDIFSLSKKVKTPLLIGAVLGDNGRYFNSALLIDSNGKTVGRYDKLHLVPFGEYIPLKKILPFLETIVPIGDITAGAEHTIFTLPTTYHLLSTKFSVLICFEDLFPELSREFVKRGANFLINITNDAWYKKTSAAYQHFQASVFRAVENRVFLGRSANTGVSGFINPDGKIISKVSDKFGRDIFIDGIDTQELAVANKSFTIYTLYGDFFPAACLLFVLYAIILHFKSKRIKKILLFSLIVFPIYLSVNLYFLDKQYFLCPIEYKREILIRNDRYGEGCFAANRNGRRAHTGIDLFAAIGTPVLASRSGKVISAKENRGMGKYIVIKHPDSIITIYGHLSKIYVAKNQFIRQGQVIGSVGKTGNANLRDIQPHLHFEVRKNGIPQDPLEYLE